MQDMNDLFVHFLKGMYHAEQQAARNAVSQLEAVFQAVGQRPEGATCEALLGMVKESEELLKETGKAGPVQDAGLIAGIQAIQHYAIARYGSLLAWANEMGQQQAAALKQVLDASKQADAMFGKLATGGINRAATAQA